MSERRKLVVLLQLIIFAWGLWLCIPLNTFGSTEVYALMARLAPEVIWGGSAMAISIFSVIALWIGEFSIARVALGTGALFWLLVSVSTGFGLLASIVVPVSFCFFIIWTYMAATVH